MEEQSRRYNKSEIDDLEDFRQNWLSELQTSTSLPKTSSEKSPSELIDDAVALYYQAAQSEDDGDMSGAVILLRKAYRMDPDLDRHVRELLAEENKNTPEPRKENLPEFTIDFLNCNGYELLEPESFEQKNASFGFTGWVFEHDFTAFSRQKNGFVELKWVCEKL